MRRVAKWLGWTVAILVGLPVLLVAILLVAANTAPGRHAIERLIPSLTGDTLRMAGLSGRFPDALRIARVELRDPQGDYSTIDDLTLDWSPLQLLHRRIVIDRLDAAQIDVMRMPASSSSSSTGLPAPLVVRELQVARLNIGAPVAGAPAVAALQGSGEASSPTSFTVSLDINRLDQPGSYRLNGSSDASGVHATLNASEPAHGLVAGLGGLPDLGAITAEATLQGPRNAVSTRVAVTAGPLRANVGGTLDLEHEAADLTVSVTAPAMQARPDLSWQAVAVDAHLQGPFTRPDATGRIRIDDLAAAGATIGSITAEIAGNAGQLRLDGQVLALHVPGPSPDLLANSPLIIQADARLDAPDRPVHLALRHTLFTVEADARTGDRRRLDATVTLHDLAPLAAVEKVALLGGMNLALHAAMQGDTTTVTADGTVSITGGMDQARALVGDAGHFALAATVHGNDLTLSNMRFEGRAASVSVNGSVISDRVDLDWSLGVTDLTAAEPHLAGQLQANGKVGGTTDNLDLTASINGGVASRGLSSGALAAQIEVHGLPKNPNARITAQGSLLDSPIDLAVSLQRNDEGLAIDIERASWKSLQAGGALQLPTSTMVPAGTLHLAMTRLADLTPLSGQPLAGNLNVMLDASPANAHVTARLEGAELAGTAAASRVTLDANVEQPQSHPSLNARLDVDGFSASGVAGSLHATAEGPADALGVKLRASLPDLHGAPGQLRADATLDAGTRSLSIASLQGDWHQQSLRLLAPAQIGFADGITIDRLRLGLQRGVLEVSGHAGNTLNVTASLRGLPADLAAAISPSYAMDGSIQADAQITGTSARPTGRVRFAATGLRLRSGPGRAVPAASITANAELNGTNAQIDARVGAGQSQLRMNGRAPLTTTGPLDMRVTGTVDLAVADPLLAAGGRRVRGRVSFDTTINGTAAAPNVAGTAQLAGGEVQDYATGVHLTDIAARLQGGGSSLRIIQLSAKAGPGTMAGSGTIGVLEPGLPLDITLTARDARPLDSDIVSATLDADLTLRGQASGQLAAGGAIRIRRAELRIPERLPTSIVVLQVQRPGERPPPSPASASTIALNLTVSAQGQVFVRGRGLDAEFGGSMQVGGTATAPVTQGALQLRRGTLSLAGRTLNFTEGQISFNGGSISDPALHLVATSTTENVVATLTIGGTAHAPKIMLSSVPALPQDEVLAHLLFGSGVGKLSVFEVAEIGASLATLTGAGGGIGDPLDKVRQDLGLDRLSVGGGGTGSSPTLEAGRYIAPGVYVGAKQSAGGGGTQAQVQIDIAKGLKLEATAGNGNSTTTGMTSESNGSSVGLTYQFEY
jgi:translocation and assembly module TamB